MRTVLGKVRSQRQFLQGFLGRDNFNHAGLFEQQGKDHRSHAPGFRQVMFLLLGHFCCKSGVSLAFKNHHPFRKLAETVKQHFHQLSLRVPPTRRPGLMARNGSAPMVDVYGYRGSDPCVRLLSPFEFYMFWGAEPVLPPSEPPRANDHSILLEAGRVLRKENPNVKLLPGVHYQAMENDNHIAFPDHKLLAKFRLRWVMVRHHRPKVPAFTRSRLPRSGISATENARICSVYLRPWTLGADADKFVPHLLQLAQLPPEFAAMPEEERRRNPYGKRIRGKAWAMQPPRASWSDAWEWYIRGNVVTEHARGVITDFLTATLARTASHDESDDEDEGATAADPPDSVKPYAPSLEKLRAIISRSSEGGEDIGSASSRAQQEQTKTIRRARSMWSSQSLGISEECWGLGSQT